MVRSAMKQTLFSIVRSAHRRVGLRPLPEKVAIYFHELEPQQWGGFRGCMEFFAQEGYRTVPVSDFVNSETEGRCLFVSFDDNYRSWHQALPLLQDLNVRATFFVNTLPFRDTCDPATISRYFDRIAHHGDRTSLSRSELREIHAAGHVIGCHSHSHRVLATLPRAQWEREIAGSKRRLEDLLQIEIRDFSYPFGMRRHFSEALRRYCQDVGFHTISAAVPGLQHVRPVDACNVQRSGWHLDQTPADNLVNLRIDGRLFARLTGRSAIG